MIVWQENRRMNTAFDPTVDGSRLSGGVKGQTGQYGCTKDELVALMTLHGQEGYHKLQDDYKPGGVLEICRRLRTSPVDGSYKPSLFAMHFSNVRFIVFLLGFSKWYNNIHICKASYGRSFRGADGRLCVTVIWLASRDKFTD